MRQLRWTTIIMMLGLSLSALSAHAAATLEVSHTPGIGQYPTVGLALAAAVDGDTIRIIDNSAPFNEAFSTSLLNLTLEGEGSLDPRPTLVGPEAISPYDAGFKTGFTYNGTGLACRNLILQTSVNNNAAVDGRFGSGAQFTNVAIQAPSDIINAFRCQTAATLSDCDITGGLFTVGMWLGGTLTLEGCRIGEDSGLVSVYLHGGTLEVHDSTISTGDGALAAVRVQTQISGVDSSATFTDCVITVDQYGSVATPNLLEIDEGNFPNQTKTVTLDNCDLVGRGDAGGGIMFNTACDVTVIDSIFSNIPAAVYGGLTADDDPVGYRLSEQYNIYKNCPALNASLVATSSRALTLSDTLYLNVRERNLQLFTNSPAATFNSTGTPAWAGSQGPYSGQYEAAAESWQRNEVDLLNGFRNMYNPHVIEDDTDPAYPYRMYFFGWAVTDCNDGYFGCDAMFIARGSALDSWEVYSGPGTWDATGDPTLWEPIILAQPNYYNETHNGDPSVVKRNGIYYMLYSATGNDLDGYPAHHPDDTDDDISVVMAATSPDGISWTIGSVPTLIHMPEVGQPNDNVALVTAEYTGMFHRPSLMWDGDHWRMWFDFWQSGNHHGTAMGHAENYGDFSNPADWVITHPLSQGLIEGWGNPDVVKVGETYYSYSDPTNYPGAEWGSWPSRQPMEATSPDGLVWTRSEAFIWPDSDTSAIQVPEAFVTTRGGGGHWINLFYASQSGGDPYNFRFKNIRMMRRAIAADDNATRHSMDLWGQE